MGKKHTAGSVQRAANSVQRAARSGGRGPKVWHIYHFDELYGVSKTWPQFRYAAAPFIRDYINSSDEVVIQLEQQLDRLRGDRRDGLALIGAWRELRQIAAARGSQHRGYLLDGNLAPAGEKQVAAWLGVSLPRARSLLRKLATAGVIELVPLPEWKSPPPRPRKPRAPRDAEAKSRDARTTSRRGRTRTDSQRPSKRHNGGNARTALVDNRKDNRQSESQYEHKEENSAIGRGQAQAWPQKAEPEGTRAPLIAPPLCPEGAMPKGQWQGPLPNAEGAMPPAEGQGPGQRAVAKPSIHQQIEAMKAADAAEGQGQVHGHGQGEPAPNLPTLPKLPKDSDAPQGSPCHKQAQRPGDSVHRGQPHRRPGPPSPLAILLPEVLAQYPGEAQAFAARIFAALGVTHNPESKEGHREYGNLAAAWVSAQLKGLSGGQLRELYDKSVISAEKQNRARHAGRKARKSFEAIWHHEFNKRRDAMARLAAGPRPATPGDVAGQAGTTPAGTGAGGCDVKSCQAGG